MVGYHRVYSGCALVLLAGGIFLASTGEPKAQSRRIPLLSRNDRAESVTPASADVGTIRLSYRDKTWSSVLRDVSDQLGMTIVMDRVPPGRVSRRDRKQYEPGEALRILNHSLEKEGFRVIPKGKYLVVMDLKQARTRYARPEIASQVASQPPQQSHSGTVRHASALLPDSRGTARPKRRRFDSAVRPVSAEEEDLFRPMTDDNEQPVPAKTEIRSVSVRNRDAIQVAKNVYSVFKGQSELIRRGPLDLPAVRVYRKAASGDDGVAFEDRPVHFTLGIDKPGNRLVVDAPPERADQLERLIRRLDRSASRDDDDFRVVAGNEQTGKIAVRLQGALNRLVAQREEPNTSRRSAEESFAQAELPDGQPPMDAQTGPLPDAAAGDDVDAMLGGLKGEVGVEAFPDLGALILRGNEADLAAVERVIRRIEELSAGTTPEIHLLTLQYVNSESMAELLTNVYDRLSELRQRSDQQGQTVAFFPVVQPNTVLILAPQVDMEAILQLADELDQPTDPSTEFEVFPLRNAIASQVVTAIESFYEERPGLGTRVRPLADSRTNSVIVQGRPREMDEVAELIRKIDRDESGSVSQVKLFPLKNAVAEELAEVINDSIQSVLSPAGQSGQLGGAAAAQGQTAQDLREVKSVVLEFLSTEGEARELIRSGILADVRVNADPRSNALLVTAPEASMRMMEMLILALDQPTATVAEIKVFTLENSDATQAVDLLSTLFEDTNQEDSIGIQIAGADDASSSLVPLRFSPDVRTNSVLAVGGAEALRVVEAILFKLDESDVRQRTNEVIKLKNSPVQDVADAINAFLEAQRDLAELDADLVSNVELLEREIIVVPEVISNSLLISATPRYYDDIHRIIDELDAAPPQVIIQALLVEVTLDNADEFGVELGFQDSILFSRSLIENIETITTVVPGNMGNPNLNQETIVSQSGNPGFLFNNVNPLGNNTSGNSTSRNRVGSQGISNFSLGRANADLGFGGFVFSASSESVSVLLRALAARRTMHVLSRPQIRTVDNLEATIQVGQQVPVVDGVTTALGVVSPTITQDDAGIILTVLPRITPDGNIVMEVAAEKSQFGATVPIFTDVNTGATIEAPIKDLTTAVSTISVPNGQTVVMGGMITKSDETIERKVPWLGDIPVIGAPFRYDATTTTRTELLIFLTPRIIYNDADSELIKQVEAERLHFIEQEIEEIHGPIYSVPADPVPYQMMGTPIDGTVAPPASGMTPELVPPAAEEVEIPNEAARSQTSETDEEPWNLSRLNAQRSRATELDAPDRPIRQISGTRQGDDQPADRPPDRGRFSSFGLRSRR